MEGRRENGEQRLACGRWLRPIAESPPLHYHRSVREKVLHYIRERKLLRAGDRVCVAVSGGADSVALLRVLLDLRAELGIVLSVAHFNHGLRGEASDADEAFVAELAKQHDLEFFFARGNVRDHAHTLKLSVEAAARKLRYQWFAQVIAQNKLNAIATGHTLDDQAETVLLKFLRGAGTRGLAGIYPEIDIGGKEAGEGRRESVSSAEADSACITNSMDAALKAGATRTSLSSATSEAPVTFQRQESLTEEPASRHRIGLPDCQDVDQTQPRMGRKSLAQHEAAGGVLGKPYEKSKSRGDDRGYGIVAEAFPREDNPDRSPGVCITRPFLDVTRQEVEQYLGALGQFWREDESNLDHRFTRNRVRHELLPLLEREYNPNIRQALSDAAELARAEEEYWRVLVQQELQARETEVVRLRLNNFPALPLALQRRLFKRLLETRQIAADFEHIEKLRRCVLGESPKAQLPGGWMASRVGECLELHPPQPAPCAADYSYSLPVPGEVRIAELGLTVRCLPVPYEFAKEEPPGSLLSAELLGRELIVRNWRPGDRFWPAQSKSEEKLKRLFGEQHIPAERRPSWPVVLHGEQIVWVRGFPVARAFAWNGCGDAVKIELLW